MQGAGVSLLAPVVGVGYQTLAKGFASALDPEIGLVTFALGVQVGDEGRARGWEGHAVEQFAG